MSSPLIRNLNVASVRIQTTPPQWRQNRDRVTAFGLTAANREEFLEGRWRVDASDQERWKRTETPGFPLLDPKVPDRDPGGLLDSLNTRL